MEGALFTGLSCCVTKLVAWCSGGMARRVPKEAVSVWFSA